MHRRQGGAALLILLLMLSVGLAGMLLSARDSAEKQRAAGTVEDAVVLARARDVLLARALADQNRPGSMPCAAENDEGKGMLSGGNCVTTFGHFPHHTLEIVPLRTRDGDPILYVMDQGLRDHPNAHPINPQEKSESLTFNGEEGYAAVLLAPGPPLPGQVRDADADIGDYLEDGNEQGPAFKDCWPGDDCNDRAIGITTDELFHYVQERLVRRVSAELRQFHQASDDETEYRDLPYAADLGSRKGGIHECLAPTRVRCSPYSASACNRSRDHACFETGVVINTDSIDNGNGTRRLKVNGESGFAAVVVAPGPPLGERAERLARPNDATQYLDPGQRDPETGRVADRYRR